MPPATRDHEASHEPSKGGAPAVLLFASGLFAILAMRYWLLVGYGGEIGTDGWFGHQMASLLAERGTAPWIIHPVSYLGMYPFGDSSGTPLVVATLSLLSGTTVEQSIVAVSFALGALLYCSGFLIGRILSARAIPSIILGFALSLAPILFHDTVATLSPRAMSVALLASGPLLLLSALSRERLPGRWTFLALTAMVLVGAFLVHKLAIFGLALVAAYLARPLFARARVYALGFKHGTKTLLLGAIAAAVILGSLLVIPLLDLEFLQSYEAGAILSGQGELVQLANIGISQAGGAGTAWLLLGLPGLAYLILKQDRTPKEAFILVAILVSVPLLFIRTYARPFMPLVLLATVPAGYTFLRERLFADRRKTMAVLIAAAAVAGTPGFTLWMNDRFIGLLPEYVNMTSPEGVEAAASYIGSELPEGSNFVASNPMIGGQLAALTDRASLPGLYAPQNWLGLYYGYLSVDEVDVTWSGLGSYLYASSTDRQMMNDFIQLFASDPGSASARSLIGRYDIDCVVEDASIPGRIPGWDYRGFMQSSFLRGLDRSAYKIYDNGAVRFWSV